MEPGQCQRLGSHQQCRQWAAARGTERGSGTGWAGVGVPGAVGCGVLSVIVASAPWKPPVVSSGPISPSLLSPDSGSITAWQRSQASSPWSCCAGNLPAWAHLQLPSFLILDVRGAENNPPPVLEGPFPTSSKTGEPHQTPLSGQDGAEGQILGNLFAQDRLVPRQLWPFLTSSGPSEFPCWHPVAMLRSPPSLLSRSIQSTPAHLPEAGWAEHPMAGRQGCWRSHAVPCLSLCTPGASTRQNSSTHTAAVPTHPHHPMHPSLPPARLPAPSIHGHLPAAPHEAPWDAGTAPPPPPSTL